jgi:hypothetical protein
MLCEVTPLTCYLFTVSAPAAFGMAVRHPTTAVYTANNNTTAHILHLHAERMQSEQPSEAHHPPLAQPTAIAILAIKFVENVKVCAHTSISHAPPVHLLDSHKGGCLSSALFRL